MIIGIIMNSMYMQPHLGGLCALELLLVIVIIISIVVFATSTFMIIGVITKQYVDGT